MVDLIDTSNPYRLVGLPDTITAGEPFDIQTLIRHPMYTGLNTDRDGIALEHHIITRLTATFETATTSSTLFSAQFSPAIARDPYVSFSAAVPENGTLTILWSDDKGRNFKEERPIKVQKSNAA